MMQQHKRKPKNPFKKLAAFTVTFLICCLVFGGVGAVVLMMNDDEDSPSSVSRDEDTISSENVLVIGNDTADGAGFLLVRFDFNAGKIPVLSLPPETNVKYRGRTDTIAGHLRYGGVQQVLGAVSELLSCTVDHYVMIDRPVLINFIDKLGGINYSVPSRITYGSEGGGPPSVLEPGNQRLTGNMAAGLISSNDAGRTVKDQLLAEVCAAALNQYLKTDLIGRANALFSFIIDKVETNFHFSDYSVFLPRLEVFYHIEKPACRVDSGGEFVAQDSGGFLYMLNDEALEKLKNLFK